MGVYHYQAVNRAGEVERGRIEAASQALAADALSRKALLPLRLEEHGAAVDWLRWWPRAGTVKRASRQDIVLLSQQLASLVRAGLTLDRALSIVLDLGETPEQRRLTEDLLLRIRRGSSFAEALEAHRVDFPGYYISMVRAGEAGGALPDILGRLTELLLRSQETRQKILSALIYPVILLAMIGVTLVLILSFVLPRFEALFAEAGSQLPLPTRLVMGLGHVVQGYGWLIGALLVLTTLLARRAWRKPELRLRFDRWLLGARLVGAVVTRIESARFARTLGTLISGGMPVPSSLRIARGALFNTALQEAADHVLLGVTEGQAFAERLAQSRRFPPLLVQMARVGEETGHLHQGLLEAAAMLDADAQRAIERGLVLLVPLVTILMGALVAALIGSVLVGILSVNDLAF